MTTVVGLDHVQLACPPGAEEQLRAFCLGVLEMAEVAKPEALVARGGVWFAAGSCVLHYGVEADFRPARKAHPALVVADVEALAVRVAAAGHDVVWSEDIPGVRRFHTSDPVGNRLEFLQHRAGA